MTDQLIDASHQSISDINFLFVMCMFHFLLF
jgi:hypothetical protein